MKKQMIKNSDRKLPKVLIVGTIPYDPNESSRALDTYFHNWPKENLRMIYSNNNLPKYESCSSFYQITDSDVLKRLFTRNKTVGRIVNTISASDNSTISKKEDSFLSRFKKKTVLRFYLRKILWSHKRWLSHNLLQWIEDFSPDMIYVCFSDDYFILDISYSLSLKYKIPIIVQIGDDYYFKKNSILLAPYLLSYKRIFKRIMNTEGFGVYISDKLAKKYNSSFYKQGFPIYLSSSIRTSKSSDFNLQFNYFGKIRHGRYKSLGLLGDALKKIDSNFSVDVYSNEDNKRIINYLKKHNCRFYSSLPYSRVAKIMNSGSFNIIASGFSKRDIEETRYSLSTKVADSLISCGPIIAVGPNGDGAIDFLNEHECAIVLNDKFINIDLLKQKIYNINYLSKISSKAKEVYRKNNIVANNRRKFEENCIVLKRGKN